MTVFECYLPNAVLEVEEKESNSQKEPQEIAQVSEAKKLDLIQVSLCFDSAELSRRVFDRLAGLSQNTHSFVEGFHPKSATVLTTSEKISDRTVAEGKRLIMFDPFSSDDEIVRGAPFRLGIRS